MCPIDPPPPLAHISLETLTAEFSGLYTHVLPPVISIPIKLAPFPVDDTSPGEEEISEEVPRIWLHHAGGPSGLKAEHLSMWDRAAEQEEISYPWRP